jgi:hypothetical protein
MPQIIVIADGEHGRAEGTVTLRERINMSDFESQTFGQRLIERLGWAVGDAHQAERGEAPRPTEDDARPTEDDAALGDLSRVPLPTS